MYTLYTYIYIYMLDFEPSTDSTPTVATPEVCIYKFISIYLYIICLYVCIYLLYV